jgi:hypothetical protein
LAWPTTFIITRQTSMARWTSIDQTVPEERPTSDLVDGTKIEKCPNNH